MLFMLGPDQFKEPDLIRQHVAGMERKLRERLVGFVRWAQHVTKIVVPKTLFHKFWPTPIPARMTQNELIQPAFLPGYWTVLDKLDFWSKYSPVLPSLVQIVALGRMHTPEVTQAPCGKDHARSW
jgi:hypothetical protein